MKPPITVITPGVDDLQNSPRFYRDGLGLRTDGIIGQEFEHGAVVFFDLQAGLRLALWPRASIAHDTGLPASSPSSTGFTLGHNVSSKAEADAAIEQARSAGAMIVKPAHDRSGAATRATSKTPITTCGRSSGIPSSRSRTEA